MRSFEQCSSDSNNGVQAVEREREREREREIERERASFIED